MLPVAQISVTLIPLKKSESNPITPPMSAPNAKEYPHTIQMMEAIIYPITLIATVLSKFLERDMPP